MFGNREVSMARVNFFKVTKWMQLRHFFAEHYPIFELAVMTAVIISALVSGVRLLTRHIIELPGVEMSGSGVIIYKPAENAVGDLPIPLHLLRIYRLGSINPAPIPALIEALNDAAPTHQRFSVFGFASLGMEAIKPLAKMGKEAVPALIGALRDPRPIIRGNAALVLGERREISSVEFLISLLRDEDLTVRLKAVMALGNIAVPSSTTALLQVARFEADPEIKGMAIRALGLRNKSPDIYAFLAGARRDPHWYVRSEALAAFRR